MAKAQKEYKRADFYAVKAGRQPVRNSGYRPLTAPIQARFESRRPSIPPESRPEAIRKPGSGRQSIRMPPLNETIILGRLRENEKPGQGHVWLWLCRPAL